jgi:hypothetical protein
MRYLSLLVAFSLGLPGIALGSETLIVSHGATPQPVYLDLGEVGDSVGDQRIFSFEGESADGATVAMEWVLTTTAKGENDVDTRLTEAVFVFSGEKAGSLLVSGVGSYPKQGSTVKVDSMLERAVIGGTGWFAAARGTLVSTHLPDNTWTHEFILR